MSVADAVAPPAVADMPTDVEAVTVPAVTTNVAAVAPAGTTTVAGTEAAALLLDRETLRPPAGAAPLMVTVPVEACPLVTVAGLRESELAAGAVTVRVADLVTPAPDAESEDVVLAATGKVVTGKVALVEPAGTVTDAGTVATAVRLLASAATYPPAGAA